MLPRSVVLPPTAVKKALDLMTRRKYCSVIPKFSVLSFYHLRPISAPSEVKTEIKNFLQFQEGRGRVYLNRNGINASVCVPHKHEPEVREFFDCILDAVPGSIRFTRHNTHFNVFPGLRVKYGKLLEGLGEDFDINLTGKHVDGEEWNRILRHQSDVVLLDVRNGYEWDVGRFKGAKRPKVTKFKHFSHIADELESFHDKSNTSVLMYCTGGIRCEVFSSVMKSKGWEDVKQLEGGVLGYSTTENTDQWEGNLFVFDDRLVVPIDGQVGGSKDIPVARCKYCGVLAEMCFNCNNIKCNEVFVSCLPCAKAQLNCCSPECRDSAKDHFIARNRRQIEGVGRGQHYRDTILSLHSHHRPLIA